jgi:2-oxoglutarate dehydrogenase E1 component
MDLPETWNVDYIDAQYQAWKADPHSVSTDWRFFFEGFEIAASGKPDISQADDMQLQSRVEALIHRYRDLGHLLACLDPLTACPTDHPLLNLSALDLSTEDLDRQAFHHQFAGDGRASLREILEGLKETYCRSIGVEFMHLQDPSERQWLLDRIEPGRNRPNLDAATRLRILQKLNQAAVFEQFLNKKYVGVTRFSLEGGDAVIPLLDALVNHSADAGCREIILGMAHRGRLNVQAHILQRPYEEIFSEFESCYDPDDLVGSGDVKYHNGYLSDIQTAGGRAVRAFLMNNPSHLESVDPVVEGFARARQDMLADNHHRQVLPLLIHGDSAFAGEGIVAETINLSQLMGYRTGGTIHLIINNQIGYTTLPQDARSTRYSTDVAKMLMVPIFHVHGEDPEAVIHVVRLAADYRMAFAKDVIIDMVCYRRYGHNEGDEPYFTQPQMYERIRQRPSLHQLYGQKLLAEAIVRQTDLDRLQIDINRQLEAAYDAVHGSQCPFPEVRFYEAWDGFHGKYSHDSVPTAVDPQTLIHLAQELAQVPSEFTINPKLHRLLEKRRQCVEQGEGIDWANAEALAFGTLLLEGMPVRLSGQDSGRGTFSQRHSVLVDTESGKTHTPLSAIKESHATFSVYDSALSEAGVLGFEYGYSLAQPQGLTIWEAQFGDFVNNAQAVIDLYIASGETKWQRLSGLVLLLPHGLEGLGPDHSSARPERFLQLCADDNLQVCNLSTPAQYFHMLRRHARSAWRKPLIIMTPKSLLRHPLAVSTLEDFARGSFQTICNDPAKPASPERVLMCSGKIYYELYQRRQEMENHGTAILRVEQYYPFPEQRLKKIVQSYRSAKQWIWVQEEPRNMGAWLFLQPRLEDVIGKSIDYIGRASSAVSATGFPRIYRQQQTAILEAALGPAPHEQNPRLQTIEG